MNRRRFLSFLSMGAVATAAAPLLKWMPKVVKPKWVPLPVDVFHSTCPAPEIAGWVSYRFHYTVTMPPDCHQRIRYINCASDE